MPDLIMQLDCAWEEATLGEYSDVTKLEILSGEKLQGYSGHKRNLDI